MTETAITGAAARHQASAEYESTSATYYWFRKRREVERLIRKHAAQLSPEHGDATFGELGCGPGIDLVRIHGVLSEATSAKWDVKALDADPGLLSRTIARADALGIADLEPLQADFNATLPLDDASLDFAYCSEVLEHLPDPDAFLAEARRVMRPGGHFLITTPNEPNVLQRAFWSKRRRAFLEQKEREPHFVSIDGNEVEVFGHISVRPAAQWDKALAAAGFELVDWGRGSLFYGGRAWQDRELPLAALFLTQAVLDAIPGSLPRRLTDQVISLYRTA